MKGYYAKENFKNAVSYADKVLLNSKIENSIKSDAQIIIARSAIKTDNESKARTSYKEVEKIASGELKAEALYYNAFLKIKMEIIEFPIKLYNNWPLTMVLINIGQQKV